ncbi:MAG: hypothetical protein HYX25_04150 [Candidatus Solibacter usitatus]|nr:hypothetical protein [Candidatus Solibacter usitatus]
MPFCISCGNQVDNAHVFCAKCGARQPVAAPPPADPLAGITPRTAAILCYIPWIGWIGSVIVLASTKFRNDRKVRFHAFQGLYLFVALLLVEWVLTPMFKVIHEPMFRVDKLLQALILFVCVFMIVKASQEETYSLPIIGELAERSAAEH